MAVAQLKTWKVFSKAQCSTIRISRRVAVAHTLLTCGNSGWQRITHKIARL